VLLCALLYCRWRGLEARRTREVLERHVAERTRELREANARFQEQIAVRERHTQERAALEARLLESQKMEAVGRLAGGVAHEFNNLLTVINGYSDLLLKDASGDTPIGRGLDEIRTAGERAALLTRRLLTFGRKQAILPEVLDLNAQLREWQSTIERMAGDQIVVHWSFAPELDPVYADRGQLMTVGLNLVTNARDAMSAGGELWIETARAVTAEGVPEVVWEIRDSGAGMDEETRRHVFEPFFTTKGVGQGAGLGMSTAYAIVVQCGGHIDLETGAGAGTRVRVHLPVHRAAPAVNRSAPPAARVPRQGRAAVLVVEDQQEVRALSVAVLKSAGYQVLEAANGDAALVLAESSGPIDLLLSDVVMPGRSGLEVARTLRARWPALRALLMSGYSETMMEPRGADTEGWHFLSKPFTPEQLLQNVQAALGRPHHSA
jgi:signal transduction histidine kinase/CheY-like chemotaxis protein